MNRKSGGRLSGQQDIRIIAILDAGYAKDGKRLSGYQKIRVQVIRTAGYQVKEQ